MSRPHIGHPDYEYRPWSAERRRRMSAHHRKRWGAPEGYATIRGVHVPLEHRSPLRYWYDWLAYHESEEYAAEWLKSLAAREWADMPRIRGLYQQRKEIAATRKAIRDAQWELIHGN